MTRLRLRLTLLFSFLALTAAFPLAVADPPAAARASGPVVVGASATSYQEADGTLVIEAVDEKRDASPSGDQVLRLAGPVQGPESLDPALARDLSTTFIVRQIFRGLTRLDRDLRPVPELADRIEVDSTGLVYTFRLRDDALFHDGEPITAEDVAFSLTRALDPNTAGGDAALLGAPTFLADIEGATEVLAGVAEELSGVAVLDERTVQIRLSRPRSTFLMRLASAPGSVVDPADVDQEEWWRAPNGSGPFRVAEWQPGDHLTLTRFDDFFAGPAPLKRVEMALGPNALQSFNLYQADAIDIDSANIAALERILAPESALRDEVTVTPLFAVDYIAFRTDVEPLDDPAIRRALQLGFPRGKVAAVTFEGYVEPAAGLVPHGMLGQEWPVEVPAYDPAAARRAIAESRYGSAERVPPIRIYLSGSGSAEALRDVIGAELGLTIEVINVDWPEFVEGLSRRSYPAYELYWGADYPDPESMLLTLFGSESADNYVDYANPAMDEVLASAAAELDPRRRAALYAEAQQLLIDDRVVIPIYYDVAYTLAKPYVKGLEVTPLGILRLDGVWLER